MNDSELLTAVREQRNKIPMTVPVEQVISRGRALRVRRRIPRLAAALAAAAGAVVAVTALLPASHPAGHQPAGHQPAGHQPAGHQPAGHQPAGHQPAGHQPAGHQPVAQLTAWTVVKLPGGDVAVTIHELYYPAGLQRKLRADGVPASVTLGAGHRYPTSCRAYPAGRALLRKVFPSDPTQPLAAIVIRPSALPAGTGVYLDDSSNPYGYFGVEAGLVHASKRCTGS